MYQCVISFHIHNIYCVYQCVISKALYKDYLDDRSMSVNYKCSLQPTSPFSVQKNKYKMFKCIYTLNMYQSVVQKKCFL